MLKLHETEGGRKGGDSKLLHSKSPNPTSTVESPVMAETGETSFLGEFREHHDLRAETVL